MLDVVTFGESMVLFTPQKEGQLKNAHLFEKSFGGAESNVAIGLARLGAKVGWFSRLGQDPFGEMLIKEIRGEGVDTSRVTFDEKHVTGIMFKEITGVGNPNVYYYRKHSAASQLSPYDVDEEYIRGAKVLHLTGITPVLSETSLQAVYKAIKCAKHHGVKICFDPNLRLKLCSLQKSREVLLNIASMSDYFLPGIDELHLLFDTKELQTITSKIRQLNIPVTIIKLGENGCMIIDSNMERKISGFTVTNVVDTVGAGDGFCAGFLYSILNGSSVEEAATFANAVGAHVVQFKGDIEGLPTKSQMDHFLHADKLRIER